MGGLGGGGVLLAAHARAALVAPAACSQGGVLGAPQTINRRLSVLNSRAGSGVVVGACWHRSQKSSFQSDRYFCGFMLY